MLVSVLLPVLGSLLVLLVVSLVLQWVHRGSSVLGLLMLCLVCVVLWYGLQFSLLSSVLSSLSWVQSSEGYVGRVLE